ncbi:MAG: pilus assembly protein TadG-related protein [Ilumatobacteraceae bacterium]
MWDRRTTWDRRRASPDRGQAIALVTIVIAVIASVAIGMASVALRLVHRSEAQTAADAAALAGATSGYASAAAVAERNGGRLVAFQSDPDGDDVTVSVTVEVGGESAVAKASTEP